MTASFPPALAGRPVTVMGLGLFGGGVATARWLCAQGARVTVTDLRDEGTLAPAIAELEGLSLRYVLGRHEVADFTGATLVVANPAVRPDNAWLTRARADGAVVTSEGELFLRTTPARLVLVTGTHGKSSTTHLLAQLLEHAGMAARAGGNIGAPLLGSAVGADEVCVVELSSYQLEALTTPCAPLPRAEAAVVTALAVDHLERHGDFDRYAAAKARIAELCPHLWLPTRLDHPAFEPLAAERFGEGAATRLDGEHFVCENQPLGLWRGLPLPGRFQRDNTLVALAVALRLGADPARLADAIPHLSGLPHRVESLGEVRGVRVVDNGVSTTPDSTLSALETIDGPCTLLMGGQSKEGLPFDGLVAAVRDRGTRIVAFGKAAPALVAAFGEVVEVAASVEDAAARGLDLTPEGGTLLFSPACASFDAYPNFRARALAFRAALDL
ncbi:MAG: UDP-N-acetylmuramoyl-L-alanine--D-glutamate ligase [Planctomycetota bacterium]|nr:UDP-N-acetylmuramoyl-L-alanine--D-glutamate ligase [Planctomycetota bacterium]